MRPGCSAAEQERTNRREVARNAYGSRALRARIAWCIVGTAVYQVGDVSRSQRANFSASNPGVHTTLAPAERLASSAPTRPCTWNKGMMLRHRSDATSPRLLAIVRA